MAECLPFSVPQFPLCKMGMVKLTLILKYFENYGVKMLNKVVVAIINNILINKAALQKHMG